MKNKYNDSKLEIAKTKTCAAMIAEAQLLYDNANWGCLTSEGLERLNRLRNEYQTIRGGEIPLTYNHPTSDNEVVVSDAQAEWDNESDESKNR